MHWLLQKNLFKEVEWDNLVATLERFQIPYSVHKVIPIIGELIPPAEPKHDKVICFGAYSMRHAAKANGWSPGVYDLFDQDFRVQLAHWRDHMLNADSTICMFKNVKIDEMTFIRPIDDSKYFAGTVFDPDEFHEWQHRICTLCEDYGNSLTGETLVQVCSPKKIYAEYRYWIIDRKVATRCRYKLGDRVIYSPQVDIRIDDFVDSINHWHPHDAYVLDVCETPDGFKIVEINSINSAGFYAANVTEIVMKLECLGNR